MKAAVLEAFHQPLVIRERAPAEPGPGEVVVAVKACGLCMTDIHIAEGRIPTVVPPRVPGHEFAGVVARLGPGVRDVAVGDRVVVCVDVACGRCAFCLRGETNLCLGLTRIGFERDGGMAEEVAVPAANLERLADSVSFEKAAVIPDAVASMYRALVSVAEVGVGTRLAILGVGGLGMQGVKIGRLLGAEITAVDLDDRKLARATGHGAAHVVNPATQTFLDAARAGLGPFDVVVDNVGAKASLIEAVTACRNGGTVVAMGYVAPVLEIPSYEIVIREKRVVGSRAITRAEFRDLVALVNRGALDPDIGERVPAARINRALDDLRHGRTLARAVLMMPF